LRQHLQTERAALFTCLTRPDVAATNWQAEQAIRPAVVTRKPPALRRQRAPSESVRFSFQGGARHGRRVFVQCPYPRRPSNGRLFRNNGGGEPVEERGALRGGGIAGDVPLAGGVEPEEQAAPVRQPAVEERRDAAQRAARPGLEQDDVGASPASRRPARAPR
jgi:hypothetical protein